MVLPRARLPLVWAPIVLAAATGCQLIAGLNDPVPPVPKADGGIDGRLDGPSSKDTAGNSDTFAPTPESSARDSSDDAGDGGPPDTGMPDAGGDGHVTDADADANADAPDVPIVFVQGNATDFGVVGSGTLDLGTTNPGDLVVVVLSYDTPAGPDPLVTDTLGDTYAIALGPLHSALDSYTRYIDYVENVPAGDLAISVALSMPPMNSFEVYAFEYSGLLPSGALDVTSSRTGTSTAVDGMKSGLKTTTAPHELIFGFGETGTASLGTGFTLRSNYNSNLVEDAIVKKIGTYQTTATMASGSEWAMLMATFKGY